MSKLETTGSTTASGQLSGFITRGGSGGAAATVEPWNPQPPAPPVVRKPSRWWRLRNAARKVLHGDAFVPLLVGVVRACRSKWVRRIPVLGKMIAGSVGALGIGGGPGVL
jgi:hypothetical protein